MASDSIGEGVAVAVGVTSAFDSVLVVDSLPVDDEEEDDVDAFFGDDDVVAEVDEVFFVVEAADVPVFFVVPEPVVDFLVVEADVDEADSCL